LRSPWRSAGEALRNFLVYCDVLGIVMTRRLLSGLSLLPLGALLAACQADISRDIDALPAAPAPSVTSAERYNAAVGICPGILLVIAHEGTSRFIALEEMTWSEGPTLRHSGATDRISADGVASGGPTWGIRDVEIRKTPPPGTSITRIF
jgi:hypothetical protein